MDTTRPWSMLWLGWPVSGSGACGEMPPPNQRMKLTVRGGLLFAGKGVTRLEWPDSSRTRTAAYARVR
jgi:hypothetical protein